MLSINVTLTLFTHFLHYMVVVWLVQNNSV